jgi:hypothetical protein
MNDDGQLRLPAVISFADLTLQRRPVTRRLLVAPAPLAALCRFDRLDSEQILADEDLSSWLICEWYCTHRLAGGEPEPVAAEILAEVAALQESRIAALQPGSGIPN